MSYITYSPNDLVYIKGIGYATLLNCGSRHTVSQMVEGLPQKKQSIYYDSLCDLFNTDLESIPSKKSLSHSQVEKDEKKLIELLSQKNVDENKQHPASQKPKEEDKKQMINIVQAKLEGNIAHIYTQEQNLTKTINLIVKSFLPNNRERIVVEIEISKNIDTLRKQIFQQMGEKIGNYYNIKLFTTNPTLSELTVHTKTISQYLIKDNAKIIMTAEYAFGFRAVANPLNSKHKITITNNLTIVSSKHTEQQKKVEEKQPAPLVEEIKQESTKVQQPKKQVVQEAEKQQVQSLPYHAKCNIEFVSGKRYWQVKVQKISADEEYLIIGVSVNPQHIQQGDSDTYSEFWGYQVISGKKIHAERNIETGTLWQQVYPYGYLIKPNDTVGVLLNFKGSKASLTFYKNSISCGEAFLIDLQSVKSSKRSLTPFVNIGGEAQVTLDSRAQIPLDSFRYK